MTGMTHIAGVERLRKFDDLSNQLSKNADTLTRQSVEMEKIGNALQATNIFNQVGDSVREAASYLLVIGVLLELMIYQIPLPDRKSYTKHIVDYGALAYNALKSSGSLRFMITGTSRLIVWLKVAYNLTKKESERIELNKVIEHYSTLFVTYLALLYRLEDDGFALVKESAIMRMQAKYAADDVVRERLNEAERKLFSLAAQAFTMTGNYAAIGELLQTSHISAVKHAEKKTKVEKPMEVEVAHPKPEPILELSMSCPKCKAGYIDGDLFCSNCGFDLRNTGKACASCSAELQSDDLFCPQCGKKVKRL